MTDAEWRARLTPEQYRIARKGGTEPAFTGEHWDRKDSGAYLCVCCYQRLFDSAHKYDSGTGWPSFHTAAPGAVGEREDRKLLVRRTEVVCARCDAHLGHVSPTARSRPAFATASTRHRSRSSVARSNSNPAAESRSAPSIKRSGASEPCSVDSAGRTSQSGEHPPPA